MVTDEKEMKMTMLSFTSYIFSKEVRKSSNLNYDHGTMLDQCVCYVFKKDARQAKNKQANKTLQAPELTP